MNTAEETAKEMQDSGHVWTDIGWVKEKSLKEAKAFLETLNPEKVISVRQGPGYGVEVKFFTNAYGWGNQSESYAVF